MKKSLSMLICLLLVILSGFSVLAASYTSSSTEDYSSVEHQLEAILAIYDENTESGIYDGEISEFMVSITEDDSYVPAFVSHYALKAFENAPEAQVDKPGKYIAVSDDEAEDINKTVLAVFPNSSFALSENNVNVDVENNYTVKFVSASDESDISKRQHIFEYEVDKDGEITKGQYSVGLSDNEGVYAVTGIEPYTAPARAAFTNSNTTATTTTPATTTPATTTPATTTPATTTPATEEQNTLSIVDSTSATTATPVADGNFTFSGVNVTSKSTYYVGDTVTISPKISGNTTGVTYKYVWDVNNWSDWAVIKGMSSDASATYTFTKPGTYKFTIDTKFGSKTVSKSVSVKVYEKGYWNISGVSVTGKSVYYPGETITIKPTMVGDTTGVTYKYVWDVDGWYDWGVIKGMSAETSATHTIVAPGRYRLTVDAKKGNKTISKSYTINVSPDILSVSVTPKSTYNTGNSVTVAPKTAGKAKNVTYKYVWDVNNWSDWGVIKGMSGSTSVTHTIAKPGTYRFTIDAKYGKKTVSKSYSVKVSSTWSHLGGTITGNTTSVYRFGEPVKITANASGSIYGAKYKFVYKYNNSWADWGVIQATSTKNYASFTPKKAGKYTIYIDMICNGKTVTKTISMNVNERWEHAGVTVPSQNIYKLNSPITITGNATGLTGDLKYKFVYSKNKWEDWGVIQATSTKNTATFTPTSKGVYEFYVDITDSRGRTVTKTKEIVVSNTGWVISDYSFSKSPGLTKTATTLKFNVKGNNTSGMQYQFRAYNQTTGASSTLMSYTSGKNSFTWTPSAAGKYTIYFDAKDSKGNVETKTATYVVNDVVTSSVKVTLSNGSATIPKGKSMYLKKNSVSPAGSTIKFVSNDTNIATVNASKGYVYAKAVGSTQIRAVDSSGKTAAVCNITVSQADPVRFAYTSPNCAAKGATVTMYATTDNTRTGVRFYVNGKYITAKKVATESNTYVWSATTSFSSAGTYSVKAYSYLNGSWKTCANGDTSVFVTSSTNSTTTTCEKRRVSDAGIQFIAESEGFSSTEYDDSAGNPTIGYGNLLTGGEQYYSSYTKREARAEMTNMVNSGSYSSAVNNLLINNSVKFNQHQFDALVSFSYNVGTGWTTDTSSSTRKYVIENKNLNNINKTGFISMFNSWHHMGGRCTGGLMNRRINELEIFFDNSYTRNMDTAYLKANSKYFTDITKCSKYGK